jgi:hypothetical protein
MLAHLYVSTRRLPCAQILNRALGDSSAHLQVAGPGGGKRTWDCERAEIATGSGYRRQVDEEDTSWWAPRNSNGKLGTDGFVKVYRALRRTRAG